MKIAIISSGFLPLVDGVTVTLLNRVHKLSQDGHQVLLFCPDYSPLETIYPDWQDYTGNFLAGVRVVNLASKSFMGLDFERNVSKKSYQTVLQELQKFQPDIIHVDEPERLSTGFLRIPGVDFAKRACIPCVSFFHTNLLEYGKDYFSTPPVVDAIIKAILKRPLSWIYNSYDLTLVASSVTHKKLSKMGIRNLFKGDLLGFDAAKFHPDLREKGFFDKKYGLADITQKVKLIFLGRLTPDKGWRFTIDTFSKFAPELNSRNIALIIAGDGSMRDEIAKKLSNLTCNVHLLGRIHPNDVPALLANSDIHVTTSEKETRGLTVLEAFAAGIPVIAPCAGGLTDSIQDGCNGFLFNPQDQDDFINKLKLLIDNPTRRQAMGAKGRQYITKYSWNNAVENLLKIWEKQIAKKA